MFRSETSGAIINGGCYLVRGAAPLCRSFRMRPPEDSNPEVSRLFPTNRQTAHSMHAEEKITHVCRFKLAQLNMRINRRPY